MPQIRGTFYFILSHMKKSIVYIFLVLALVSCTSTENETQEPVVELNNQEQVLTKEQQLLNIEEEIKQNPNNHIGYLNRALYWLNNKELDLAYEDINKAIKLSPEDAETNFAKAKILYYSSKMDMAVAFFERTLQLDSNHTGAMLKLAYINLAIPNLDEAVYYINRALKVDKYLAEPYYLKGMYYELQGNNALASSSYQTAIERNPDYYEAYLAQGDIHNRMDKPIAIDYYKSALRIKPNSIEAWRTMGLSYKDHNQFDDALICFDTITTIDSTFEVAYFDAGVTYLAMCYDNNPKATNDSLLNLALSRFDRALHFNVNYVPARYNRGLCFEEMGDKETARTEYKKVLELEPNYDLAVKGMNRLDK